MSHVDEGTLHALVDNALDADERRAVEAHLASCGDCARRFAEATAMARQVTSLLGALDDVTGTASIVKPVAKAIAPSPNDAVPGVTPIRRRFFTLKRAALAASVLFVAGVSYQVSNRVDKRATATLVIPVMAAPRAAPMIATPSVVDAPADSLVVMVPAAARQRARNGPRNESEVAMADRVADASKKASSESSVTQPAQEAVMKPLPMVAADVARDTTLPRRRDERSSQDALGRVQGQEQARVQQNSPSPQSASVLPAPSKTRQEQQRLEGVVVTGAPAAAPAAASSAGVAKRAMPKPAALPGYVATDDQSLPSVTRRTYVSSSGTALMLLITQPLAEAKAPAAGARAPEFVVTTDSGRSIVRWHARGFDYELQALLTPDSLVKLATQIK